MQEREAVQSLASSIPLPRAPRLQTTETGLASGAIEQQYKDGPLDPSPCRPKCAVYFNTLVKARWGSFGPWCRGLPNHWLLRFGFFSPTMAKQVYYELMDRLAQVELANHYIKTPERGISAGMTAEDSRLFSLQQLIPEAGKGHGVEREIEVQSDKLVQDFDKRLSLALQWEVLLDAVGVPEVLLICYEPGEELCWDYDIPVVRTELASHHENIYPLTDLLSPRLALKETCVRLSGLVDMIKRLGESDCPQLKGFLAEEIERRVRNMFGDPDTSTDEEDLIEEDYDRDNDSDEIMEDAY